MAEYIEREAAIRALTLHDCDSAGAKMAICDLPAADVAPVRRWIPVTERLPECGKRVLATDGGFVGEFYINKRGQWKRYNVNDYSLLMALDILFWMPMPEPPKEETP